MPVRVVGFVTVVLLLPVIRFVAEVRKVRERRDASRDQRRRVNGSDERIPSTVDDRRNGHDPLTPSCEGHVRWTASGTNLEDCVRVSLSRTSQNETVAALVTVEPDAVVPEHLIQDASTQLECAPRASFPSTPRVRPRF